MKKNKILLIDDDSIFLSITLEILKRIPFPEEVYFFTHVKEAREYFDACVTGKYSFPDAIFLDIHMPGIGGLEFADLYSRRYAAQYPDTKLIILTSFKRQKDRVKALEIPGVKEFMQKPLTEHMPSSLLR